MASPVRHPLVLAALLGGCGGDEPDRSPEALVRIDARDASYVVDEDGSVLLQLDLSGAQGAVVAIDQQPSLGALTGSGTLWTYTPLPDVSGTDRFRWSATAEGTAGDSATVTITIRPLNDAPFAAERALVTLEDTPLTVHLEARDPDGDPLTWLLIAPPARGSADLDPGTGRLTWSPDADYVGADTLRWSAVDPHGASTGTRRLDLDVTPVGDGPIALPGLLVVAEDTEGNGALAGIDPDGDTLTWTLITDVRNGSLVLDPGGAYQYLPERDYVGDDRFEVVASDGTSDSPPAAVQIVVGPVNDVPVVDPAAFSTPQDTRLTGTMTGSDVEGDPITWQLAAPPLHGLLAMQPDGSFTYDPDPAFVGGDTFSVTASDGEDVTADVPVGIEVLDANEAPTAVGGLLVTDEDTPVNGQISASDPDGDALHYTLIAPPVAGTVDLDPDTGAFTYTPDPDIHGEDAFVARADDGELESGDARIQLIIRPVNDPPLPADLTWWVSEDIGGATSLATVDPDGDPVFYLEVTPPLHGTGSLHPTTGWYTYLPDPGYLGPDAMVFEVSDGVLKRSSTLTIEVKTDGEGDGIVDALDVCPTVPDPSQADANGNGLGDACDCWADPFSIPLDPQWQAHGAEASPDEAASPVAAVRLVGDGALLESAPAVAGCDAHVYAFQARPGTPAADPGDRLIFQAREPAGPWVEITAVDAADLGPAWTTVQGSTAGMGLTGAELVWAFTVAADEPGDVFWLDDVWIGCDSDSDDLADCDEADLGWDALTADADGDGLGDGAEHHGGTDPDDADTDGDGVDDGLDSCPTVANPAQGPCDDPMVDDFESGDADPARWSELVGDGDVVPDFSVSGLYSVNLGGGTAWLATVPLDFGLCPAATVDLFVRGGPEAPDANDRLALEAEGPGGWSALHAIGGVGVEVPFQQLLWPFQQPVALQDGVRLRLHSTGSGPGNDDWYVDDIHLGCDHDQDGLPSSIEAARYGTSPWLADTDRDGVEDGDEVLAGTDPTNRLH